MGAFDLFNKKKIGFGKNYRSGKGYFNRVGLEGAFRKLKHAGRYGAAKNLSSKDIDRFQKLLEKKLKSKYTYSKGLNYQDRLELNHILEEWIEEGKISEPDKEDFDKIIDQLSD